MLNIELASMAKLHVLGPFSVGAPGNLPSLSCPKPGPECRVSLGPAGM